MVPGFHIAPFAPDGASLGEGYWELAKLSPKWLDSCDEFISANGHSFLASWGGNLDRITTKCTSSDGAALVTFYVEQSIVVSGCLVSGANRDTDSELLAMFVESLRRVDFVRLVAPSSTPFESAFSITDRPLALLVSWPRQSASEDDVHLVRELMLHFTGAYFRRCVRRGR